VVVFALGFFEVRKPRFIAGGASVGAVGGSAPERASVGVFRDGFFFLRTAGCSREGDGAGGGALGGDLAPSRKPRSKEVSRADDGGVSSFGETVFSADDAAATTGDSFFLVCVGAAAEG